MTKLRVVLSCPVGSPLLCENDLLESMLFLLGCVSSSPDISGGLEHYNGPNQFDSLISLKHLGVYLRMAI